MTSVRGVEAWQELPPSGKPVFYYPAGTSEGGVKADGQLLRVSRSDGTFWYAMCRGSRDRADGIFRFEGDAPCFVVVRAHDAYSLSYDDPSAWEHAPLSHRVKFAVHHTEANIVLLFDWFSGVGYGPLGLIWKTPRLFLDFLEVVRWDDTSVYLNGVDDNGVDRRDVVLDVRDGRIVSGHASRFN